MIELKKLAYNPTVVSIFSGCGGLDLGFHEQWKNNLSSTSFCAGNPLFIVDDEADAASLNTMVNRNKQSTINKNLEEIKKTTSSSIYMEVTGTPQSILLQTQKSGWKPYFIYYFKPGKGYLGGNFFFTPEPPAQIILTDNEEAQELLNDDEFPENGLKTALMMHLISSAHILLSGGTVCNFLIHPSVKICTQQFRRIADIALFCKSIAFATHFRKKLFKFVCPFLPCTRNKVEYNSNIPKI